MSLNANPFSCIVTLYICYCWSPLFIHSPGTLWKSEGQKDGILDNRHEVNKKSVLTLNMLLFWSSCCSYVDIDQRQSEGTVMGYSRKKSACVPPALHVPWWLNKKYAMLPDSIRQSCSPRGRTERQCCIIASYLCHAYKLLCMLQGLALSWLKCQHAMSFWLFCGQMNVCKLAEIIHFFLRMWVLLCIRS